MMKFTWSFLINEILISTFQNICSTKKKHVIPYIMIPWNRDIFWDDYHSVKISYRYSPSQNTYIKMIPFRLSLYSFTKCLFKKD